MFNTLDEFDLKVALAVTQAFPQWSEHALIEESDGERAFVLSIVPPSQNVAHALRIDTFGGEVTVSFEHYHAHFDDFVNGTEQDALTLVTQIVSDEYAIVSYWRDDQWCGSTLLVRNSIPINNEEYPYANRIHIRSWNGTLDNDIQCVPRD